MILAVTVNKFSGSGSGSTMPMPILLMVVDADDAHPSRTLKLGSAIRQTYKRPMESKAPRNVPNFSHTVS